MTDNLTNTPAEPAPLSIDQEVAHIAKIDAEGIIHAELPCVTCGYTLMQQPIGAHCPECGTPVADSLKRERIAFTKLRYLQRLRGGAITVAVGLPLCLFCIGLVAVPLGTLAMLIDLDKDPYERNVLRRIAGYSILIAVLSYFGMFLIFTQSMQQLMTGSSDFVLMSLVQVLGYVALVGLVTHVAAMSWWVGQMGRRLRFELLKWLAVAMFWMLGALVLLSIFASVFSYFYPSSWGTQQPNPQSQAVEMTHLALYLISNFMMLAIALLYMAIMIFFAVKISPAIKHAKHLKATRFAIT